jgi:hypothetical protein
MRSCSLTIPRTSPHLLKSPFKEALIIDELRTLPAVVTSNKCLQVAEAPLSWVEIRAIWWEEADPNTTPV